MTRIEKNKRSIAKAIMYRALIIFANGGVIFALTHDYDTTVNMTLGISITSTILYYLHERLWNKITWGTADEKVPVLEKNAPSESDQIKI